MHTRPDIQDKTHDGALYATNLAMDGEIANRETRKGRLYGAAAVPVITKPTSSYCGHSEEQSHSYHGRGGKYFSCNYGSAVSLLSKRDMDQMKSL